MNYTKIKFIGTLLLIATLLLSSFVFAKQISIATRHKPAQPIQSQMMHVPTLAARMMQSRSIALDTKIHPNDLPSSRARFAQMPAKKAIVQNVDVKLTTDSSSTPTGQVTVSLESEKPALIGKIKPRPRNLVTTKSNTPLRNFAGKKFESKKFDPKGTTKK